MHMCHSTWHQPLSLHHKHVSHPVHSLPWLTRFTSLSPLICVEELRVEWVWKKERRNEGCRSCTLNAAHFCSEDQDAHAHLLRSLLLLLFPSLFQSFGDCLHVAVKAIWLHVLSGFLAVRSRPTVTTCMGKKTADQKAVLSSMLYTNKEAILKITCAINIV